MLPNLSHLKFFPQGPAPNPSEIWASPVHAQTLQEIADSKGESFYRAKLAEAIIEFAFETGGLRRIILFV